MPDNDTRLIRSAPPDTNAGSAAEAAVPPAKTVEPSAARPAQPAPPPSFLPAQGLQQSPSAGKPLYGTSNTPPPAPAGGQPPHGTPRAVPPAPPAYPAYGIQPPMAGPAQPGYPGRRPYSGSAPVAPFIPPYPVQPAPPAGLPQHPYGGGVPISANRPAYAVLSGKPAPAADAPADRLCAGFLPRFSAFALDCALVTLPWLIFWARARGGGLGDLLSQAVFFGFTGFALTRYALLAFYFTVVTAITGTTAGKRMMRLRVVRVDGGRAGWGIVLYRETVGRILSAFLCIGYLVLAADRQHRGFHDMLADTRVIYDMP